MATFERFLTEEEQRRLWRAMQLQSGNVVARRDLAWMKFLCSTGLRLGEFARVTVGDALAALRSGYLFIPKERRKGGKVGRAEDLRVLMTEERRALLRALLGARAEMTGGESTGGEVPLVVARGGEGMTHRAFQLRGKHWAAVAGLPDGFSPHWLRHTTAKNVMRHSTAKEPLLVVQQILGHRDLSSTGIYAAVDREEVARAIEEVESKGRRVSKRRLRKEFERRAGG